MVGIQLHEALYRFDICMFHIMFWRFSFITVCKGSRTSATSDLPIASFFFLLTPRTNANVSLQICCPLKNNPVPTSPFLLICVFCIVLNPKTACDEKAETLLQYQVQLLTFLGSFHVFNQRFPVNSCTAGLPVHTYTFTCFSFQCKY